MQGIALFGYNITYSLSPLIHNTAFKIKNLPYAYIPVDVPPEKLEKSIEAIRLLRFAGANVTIPYKRASMKWITSLSDIALRLGAINTIKFENDEMTGDNTDFSGFLNAYKSDLVLLDNKSVLIIGSGGGARAVCHALIMVVKPDRIFITGRTSENVNMLVDNLIDTTGYDKVVPLSWNTAELSDRAENIAGIIQTTPVGSESIKDQSPLPKSFAFSSSQLVIDLVYRPSETKLLNKARSSGATTRNGLDMLLHQAAQSFQIWTGEEFPMAEVSKVVKQNVYTA